ncbi:hypothetical protein GQ43DRAFT_474186 [Delitschia confertaspora ATCC 74209]|uniref:AMP-activated protein kinase glycogen-binding domain-containing protein n=1 Tax=Delitschia confertaspora ATCC 74209 TaxID=1513339 RepID=A0A9P4MQ05_9PLEO|nr:hypothetical protein GQ43DRAFT_474186 [Delitschia confertaspora ATCC 74209]
MGSYTFVWEHPAEEVYVTGTFDDWKQTVKLAQVGGVFKKTVELPKTKVQYKFVVDGKWCTNDTAPGEDDGHSNYNNVLYPNDIKEEPLHTLSSVAPESSTAELAGAVPKNKRADDDHVPGAFPETPAGELQSFSVNPIPATSGLGNPVHIAPGDKVPEPSTLTDNTIHSTVHHEKEREIPEASVSVAPIPATAGLGNPIHLAPGEKVPDASTLTDNTIHSTVHHEKQAEIPDASVSVAPIPATAGLGNPIHLAPGEKVPDASTFTSNTVSSTAKTDADSYQKSDALPAQLGPVVTGDEPVFNGGMFNLPPVSGASIPESSLPKNPPAVTNNDSGFTVQSVTPTSTTAALAADVPKEPRGVPEKVVESQKEAHFSPEATANPDAVLEKTEVEKELKEKVAEVPAIPEDSVDKSPSDGPGLPAQVVGAALGAAATLATAAVAAKDLASEALGNIPTPVKETVTSAPATAASTLTDAAYAAKDKATEAVNSIPISKETITSVPATAASTVTDVAYATKDKASETYENLPVSKETVTSAPASAASTFAAATYAAKDKAAEAFGLSAQAPEPSGPAPEVPEAVTHSLEEAHAAPEAAASSKAVTEKAAVEKELLSEVWTTNEPGEPAPKITTAPEEKIPDGPASAVPEPVVKSIEEAHAAPEAAVDADAVGGKAAVESQLLREVWTTNEPGEPAPKITATPEEKVPDGPVSAVPEPVVTSLGEAHAAPEAAANPEAVGVKATVESELLREVKRTDEAGEPAPAVSAALTATAPGSPPVAESNVKSTTAESFSADSSKASEGYEALNAPAESVAIPPTSKPAADSRDVSPMSKQPTTSTEQTQPMVTTGVETSKAPETSKVEEATAPAPATPKKDPAPTTEAETAHATPETTQAAPESVASGTDKKKKRRSIFGKLKDKILH